MDKIKLFLDFDNTIVNSTKGFCDTYNFMFQDLKNFQQAKWYEAEKYNFSDQCPLVHNVHTIFEHPHFFNKLEFINCNTQEVIEKLNNKYEVIICTIGTLTNISLKSIWLKKNLPNINSHIFLVNNGCKMDKSLVDMNGAIFIDDVVSNLDSSNARMKFVFGDIYEWNNVSGYGRCFNWTDIENLLLL